MKKHIKTVINVILVLILIYSGYKIYSKLADYKKADETYTQLQEIHNNQIANSTINNEDNKKNKPSNENKESNKSNDDKIENNDKTENSKSLSEINSDYKFWLNVNNTNINYPVVQCDNNSFYLKHDFYKQNSSSGAIFMDYRDNQESQNTILYGHNMRNKTMFNNLLKFKDEAFFNQNNKIKVMKDDQEYIYEVFSAYTTEGNDDYLITNFSSNQEYQKYINDIKTKSLFKSNVEVSEKDKIITLSTCSYEFDDARTVVHGKLVTLS